MADLLRTCVSRRKISFFSRGEEGEVIEAEALKWLPLTAAEEAEVEAEVAAQVEAAVAAALLANQ